MHALLFELIDICNLGPLFQMKRNIIRPWFLAFAMLLVPSASAAEKAKPPVYESGVRTLLQKKCVACHDAETKESGLDLSSPQGILQGSDSGRVLTAGDTEGSLLLEMIESGEMPPDEEDDLTAHEIDTIRNWIAGGAKFKASVSSEAEITQHDVIPLLYLRCVVCHGERVQQGGLDLRTKASILKGGKSGPACVSGDSKASLMIERVHAGEMPPKRKLVEFSVKPMAESELALLSRWVDLGLPEADDPEDQSKNEHTIPLDEREFWSFQPPRRPKVPRVQAQDRVRNPIDSFILRKLEKEGLSLAPDAERSVLLRRVYFDLTGLPPTIAEVAEFLGDPNPQAYENVVERLLNSQRYGERWGRHWLDAAGYSDSEGAQDEDRVRHHMYRYRDYVIRSFNADKSYSRFLIEQLAGDELADFENADFENIEAITPEIYDNLVATGFLRTAPDRTFANITNFVPDRLGVIADEIDILGSAVMGLTFKCARCHSHKFDPIPQRDYYRLTAIFKDAFDEHDWLRSDGGRTLPYVLPAERNAYLALTTDIDSKIAALRSELAECVPKARSRQVEIQLTQLSPIDREKVEAVQTLDVKIRTAEQNALLESAIPALAVNVEGLKNLDAAFGEKAKKIDAEINELIAQRGREPRIRALWSRGTPSPSYILKRGNYQTPGRPVAPGVPAILDDPDHPYVPIPRPNGSNATGRRLAFAKWLTRPNHPLTSRVMVNRLWMHHFGRGIVPTPDNFGKAGQPPTHPQLLDWLATEFSASDWSLKAMHRLVVNSSTYRQSSHPPHSSLKQDPEGTRYSRAPLRRLEAEVIRDTLLFVAGTLDETPFGPADEVDVRADGLATSKATEKGRRRSIYVLQRRTQIPTLLENFDFPQMGPNCIQRSQSLVAPQSLHMMNNKLVHQLAGHFATQVLVDKQNSPTQLVVRVYQRAFSRSPNEDEQRVGETAIKELTQHWRSAHPDQSQDVTLHNALTTFCHTIFNLAEFIYVE